MRYKQNQKHITFTDQHTPLTISHCCYKQDDVSRMGLSENLICINTPLWIKCCSLFWAFVKLTFVWILCNIEGYSVYNMIKIYILVSSVIYIQFEMLVKSIWIRITTAHGSHIYVFVCRRWVIDPIQLFVHARRK